MKEDVCKTPKTSANGVWGHISTTSVLFLRCSSLLSYPPVFLSSLLLALLSLFSLSAFSLCVFWWGVGECVYTTVQLT